ncbi:MAG TPA: M20/M25/M40 family metallo-hydrolase, partial [Longimicrobium sp.]|nr:M20/M25/M40 family metallo-hydrolase [Longimicrobium sp.]
MKRTLPFAALAAASVLAGAPARAQQQTPSPPPAAPTPPPAWASGDPVLQRIWDEGMNRSRVQPLAQALMDSVGPRLTGSPSIQAAYQWAIQTYAGWGITAQARQYGTWRGWQRGYTHVDLVSPRVRTLEGTMLAWSPGTDGPVTGPVVILPEVADSNAFRAWLPDARGKYVLVSFPQPTCRPDENWVKYALPDSFERMKAERTAGTQAWAARIQKTGYDTRTLPRALEDAGALGVVTNLWSAGWGVDKIFNARTMRVPTIDLGCEDYGLVYRLAQNGQGPQLRLDAQAHFPGDLPASNVIAEMRGVRTPNEYVMLSAHFDSWDGGSGATDNGTGTVVMMEAMRILKAVYPRPRRTILAGHWSGEEQGLNGSRAFVEDNPQVVQNLQALFNQDNGTGRIANLSMQGFTRVAPVFRRWLSMLPPVLVDSIHVADPGLPSAGGTDNASFVCAGAPAFGLGSLSWEYGTYTWHTNRDTYDKVVFDEVRRNATLTAMLVYLASEEPERLPRERIAEFPVDQRTGQRGSWPECQAPARNTAQ